MKTTRRAAPVSSTLAALDEEERASARRRVLDPNQGEALKLGYYSFGVSQTLQIGKRCELSMMDMPTCTFRPKRVVMNAPCVGFVTISNILMSNVATTIGGAEDAYAYRPDSFGCKVANFFTLFS